MEQHYIIIYQTSRAYLSVGGRNEEDGGGGGKRDAEKGRRRRGKCVGIANREWRHLRRIINLRVCEVRR